jgi:hypothetical membrane protein
MSEKFQHSFVDPTTAETILSLRARAVGGLLLFVVGLVALMGIITAEAFYPGYNAGVQEISDLGASRPPNSVIVQPAATIFNTAMVLSGLLVLAATYALHRAFGDRAVTVVFGLFGLGILGVGVFDGSEAPMHGISALLTFFTGGLLGIVVARVVATPFRYVSLLVGGFVLALLVSIIALGLAGIAHPFLFLGMGGLERYVTYPFLLWLLAFGGYLMAPVPASSRPSE